MGSPRSGRFALLIAAAVAGASCSLINDLDDLAGGDTAGGAGGSGPLPPPAECNGGEGVCLAGIPEGWEGYYHLYATALGEGAAQCPDGSALIRSYSGPSIAGAQCEACTCTPIALQCSAPLDVYADDECTIFPFPVTAGLGCLETSLGFDACETGAPSTIAATCDAAGGAVQSIDPQWAQENGLCGAIVFGGGRCEAQATCVQKGGGSKVCIATDGDSAGCPPGWEGAERITTHTEGTDDRGCSPCVCQPPGDDACAGGTYELFGNPSCSGQPDFSLPPSSGCADVTGNESVRYVPPSDVACAPTGGEPAGVVVPGPARTLCCR